MTFYDYLKNIFLILIILSIAPTMINNLTKQYGRYFTRRARVGVLPMRTVLSDSTSYSKQLRLFFEDSSIAAILIKMECPGGATGTAQAITNELLALKKDHPKPVIVLVENVCASGGYYIASAADYIISPASALIGSIGTTMPYLFKVNKLVAHYDVDYTPVAAGKYKNATNPFVQANPEDTALLQGVANDSYDQFLHDISNNRKLSMETAAEWGEAKIFTGRQALKLGLIDEIGSISNAMAAIRKKANLDEKIKIEWICAPKKRTLWNLFASDDSDICSEDESMFSHFATSVCDKLEERLLQPTLLLH
jgi:protease IV